jgi:glutamate/tyrosine decarboxylase-like PLP-dependent enzyme
MKQTPGQRLPCDPRDVGLKSFFLGPQSENALWVLDLVHELLTRWFAWRRRLHPGDGEAISRSDQETREFLKRRRDFAATLGELAHRFEDEVPKFSPRYIGHMFSEISLPALLGHVTALLHNPNIISGESARVGVTVEDQAIHALARMLGMPAGTSGHFTSGGTVANFEALVRARGRMAAWLARVAATEPTMSLFAAAHCGWAAFDRLPAAPAAAGFNVVESNPFEAGERLSAVFGAKYRGPVVLVPENKHYSWLKGVSLLGLGEEAFWPVALDARGRLDIASLRSRLAQSEAQGRPVLMVVSVAGTTELGQFDPVDKVQDLLDELRTARGLHVWHHVDAAYGGFFGALAPDSPARAGTAMDRALAAVPRVDSVTLDPHKLGYVPYATGTILVRDSRDYLVRAVGAPYIRTSGNDRGPYTLEGSRAATGAAATWATARTIGLDGEGYGRILARTIRSRHHLSEALHASGLPVRIAPDCEANVIGFTLAPEGEPLSVTNTRTEHLFEAFARGRGNGFAVSKTTLYAKSYDAYLRRFVAQWTHAVDADHLVLLRCCLLNPFFDSQEMHVHFPEEFVKTLRRLLAEQVTTPATCRVDTASVL